MNPPKFRIDNIVCMEDDFHFNPADEALSIGKIEAIHIIRGKGVFKGRGQANKRILYSVSGFSLQPEEKELMLLEDVPSLFLHTEKE